MTTRRRQHQDWTAKVWECDRADRFNVFRGAARYLSDEEFWTVLEQVYVDAEDRTVKLLLLDMMRSSRRPRREGLMTDEERATLAGLTEDFIIWRGDVDGNPRGWSWTLDQGRAEWFARRWELMLHIRVGKPARLLRGVCTKRDVLAYFARREEAEVIVDPAHVRDVRAEPLTTPSLVDGTK